MMVLMPSSGILYLHTALFLTSGSITEVQVDL